MTARWHHRWRRASERSPRATRMCLSRLSFSPFSNPIRALNEFHLQHFDPDGRSQRTLSHPPYLLLGAQTAHAHRMRRLLRPTLNLAGQRLSCPRRREKKRNATPDDVVTAPISIAGRVRLYPQFQTSFIPAVIIAQTFPGPGILHLNDNRRRFLFLVRGNRRRK